jgi:hypothetical protein
MTQRNQPVVRVDIDWDALEIAVERNAPDTESFLDLTTGHIVTVVTGDPEAPMRRQLVSENIKNFLRIEPASSREQYRWMERFVQSVSEEPLRERLIISIDGKGAFRRFKDVLLAYPAERERWFSYRADLLHWHIHNWLEENGIESNAAAPWGQAQPPPELPQVPGKPVVHGAESPGEALRRQARELIENIAAIDLPSAIAFLSFLKERGGDILAPAHAASGDAGLEDAERDRDRDASSGADSDDSDTSEADRRRFAG